MRQADSASLLRIFRNTYLGGSRSLFKVVITERRRDEALLEQGRRTPSIYSRSLRRLRPWFWPNVDAARVWAEASASTSFDPNAYLREEPRRLLARLIQEVPREASVLDLGCNSGADLNILRSRGFSRLWGVDAGSEALRIFAREYPDTFSMATIEHNLFQSFLLGCDSRQFDVIHSNGATIELVHPSFPIVAEICRVASRWVFVAIEERGQAFPRNYLHQFERNGFRLTYCERDVKLEHQSLLQFERFRY